MVTQHDINMATSPSYRLSHMGLKVDGVEFNLQLYPFLMELFDVRARYRTILKGAQMGFTIQAVVQSIEDSRTLPLRGILYLFPTDADVIDFSKARFGPISENEAFRHLFTKTDAAGLKKIGEGFVYFRGAGAKGAATTTSVSKLKSIPVDQLKLDERDEMQDQRVDAAFHRLDSSYCPEVHELSTPTVPGYGVDLSYKTSDQRTWFWKCTHCGKWTCLELSWPYCIVEPEGKEAYYQCDHCSKELYRVEGEWVAKESKFAGELIHTPAGMTWTGRLGYWVSQLCSPTKTAQDIVNARIAAEESGRWREYYNQTLARAYADIEDMLTKEIIDECIGNEPRALTSPGPCCMGVDPGVKRSWWWVKERIGANKTRTLNYGYAESFDELASIARKFNVQCGVMDGMAETHAVRKFVSSNPGWWSCRYSTSAKETYDWDYKNRIVKVGRTKALDASHDKFLSRNEELPQRNEMYEKEVIPQLTNMARMRKSDEKTGQTNMVWVIAGGAKNDHLKHAHGYATIAEEHTGVAERIINARKRRYGPRKRRSFMGS